MSVVQRSVGDLHRLANGGVPTTKLYLKMGTGNSLQEGRESIAKQARRIVRTRSKEACT